MIKILIPIKERPDYTDVDHKDKEAHVGSRTNILSKSFTTDLWMRVITKAIDDIALFRVTKEKGKQLRDEELEDEQSAIDFLFNDDHRIPFDNYLIDIICPSCKCISTEYITRVVGQRLMCHECTYLYNKNIDFVISEDQDIKDISLKELISLWNIDNIDDFRIGIRRRIEEIVSKKIESLTK